MIVISKNGELFDIRLQNNKITRRLHDRITNYGKSNLKNNKEKVIVSVSDEYKITSLIESIKSNLNINKDEIDNTDYYVFLELTKEQILKLEEIVEVRNVWLDELLKPMDETALQTINSENYYVNTPKICDDITWAVIDDGVDSEHIALKYSNVINIDLTGDGPSGGHGTFVAGIIAGYYPEKPFYGVAPKCQLYNFKVISNNANWVSLTIKAMEKIRTINKNDGKLVIQGANMSLGVPNECNIGQYYTGHSPICEEANRLVESGVVVCVSAGNYGVQAFEVPAKDGKESMWVNFELNTICDPGNAEAVITVGSTHKKEPNKYGVSYFSSKGPTGDGRSKPDMVAPGENIFSIAPDNAYTVQSGTSASSPFVAGVAAQLLHSYPDLIGNPMKLKDILKEACKDLNRTTFYQGRGLVDLKKSLELTKNLYNSM